MARRSRAKPAPAPPSAPPSAPKVTQVLYDIEDGAVHLILRHLDHPPLVVKFDEVSQELLVDYLVSRGVPKDVAVRYVARMAAANPTLFVAREAPKVTARQVRRWHAARRRQRRS